jgi:hypothetical protein
MIFGLLVNMYYFLFNNSKKNGNDRYRKQVSTKRTDHSKKTEK